MARRRLLVDVTPLRQSNGFRALFAGQIVSFIGTQITVVAVAYQVFVLTDSSFAVGLVSLVQLPPLLVGSLIGGAVVDSTDRRRLLMVMQVLLALCSVVLALNATLDDPAIWPLYVITALAAGLSGLDRPARSAVIPGMVDQGQLPAAFALWQVQMTSGLAVGPALGGLVLGQFGVAGAFWIDAGTFVFAFLSCTRLPPLPPEGGGTKVSLGSIAEGLRFVRGSRALQGTFIIDINAMVFGMPRALFPALALGTFGGGPNTVGLLFAAPGAGALLGALTSGWVGHVRRQGLAVYVAVAAWGLAIVAFGATTWLPLALVLLALAGAADVVSAVFRSTVLQASVPDALRGRLSALHIAVVTGGPRLGDLEAGAVASLTTPRISVVSGGAACVAGVLLLAWLLPELRRYALPAPAIHSDPDG
jgi:predicted MFS family arabinose efflux permease